MLRIDVSLHAAILAQVRALLLDAATARTLAIAAAQNREKQPATSVHAYVDKNEQLESKAIPRPRMQSGNISTDKRTEHDQGS